MNDMTVQTGGAVALPADFDPYAEYGRQNSNNIVGKLMRFAKGDWLVGDDEIQEGSHMIAGIRSLLIGWIKWENQKPIETLMGLLEERFKPQDRKTLGDLDEAYWEKDKDGKPQDPWQLTNYLPLADLNNGDLYTYSTASTGGRNAISNLCRDFGTKRRMFPGKLPVIALNVDSYNHKDKALGKIKVPELKIVGWVPEEAFEIGPEAATDKAQHQLALVESEADKLLAGVGRGGGTTTPAQGAKF